MALQRFITLVNGVRQAMQALVVSTGVSDGGKIVVTDPVTGKLDLSVMPSGVGADADTALADLGGLSAGDIVNLYGSGGDLTARKADATSEGKHATGFVLAAASAGSSITVHRPGGTIAGLLGLTKGTLYYLSTTAGQLTDTPPSGTGNVVQSIGIATSATTLAFQPSEPITLA